MLTNQFCCQVFFPAPTGFVDAATTYWEAGGKWDQCQKKLLWRLRRKFESDLTWGISEVAWDCSFHNPTRISRVCCWVQELYWGLKIQNFGNQVPGTGANYSSWSQHAGCTETICAKVVRITQSNINFGWEWKNFIHFMYLPLFLSMKLV